jgi:hypothetical protein
MRKAVFFILENLYILSSLYLMALFRAVHLFASVVFKMEGVRVPNLRVVRGAGGLILMPDDG